MSVKTDNLKDEGTRLQVVTSGAVAGLVSRFVIAPLDVIKIRLQLQTHSLARNASPFTSGLASTSATPTATSTASTPPLSTSAPAYRGIYQTTRNILRNEGIPALWKGNVPAELMYISYGAIQFTTYRSVAQLLHSPILLTRQESSSPNNSNHHHHLPMAAESFICGATAAAVATASTYPLDLLRTRFAAQGSGKDKIYASLYKAIAQTGREEGVRGFFRGLGPAIGQIVPFMGLFFAGYETLRIPFSHVEVLAPFGGSDAAAGVVASVVAKTGVYPLDLVRKRIQVQGPMRGRYVGGGIPRYEGMGAWRVARTIVGVEGWRGLYRGLGVGLLKAAPANAVTVWTYERVLGLLTVKDEKVV